MTHLSAQEVQQLRLSALPEDELAAAAVHTAECESCHRLFVDELKRQQGSVPSNFTLEPGFWFRNDHVDFEQLVALADKTLDQETDEIINIHLSACERCDEDVRSFLASRNASAREIETASDPANYVSSPNVPSVLWQRLSSRPTYAIAAIVLAALTVLIGLIALNRRSISFEAGRRDQPPRIAPSPNLSASPAPGVVSSPSIVEDSEKVAILKDGRGEVTVAKNGRLTGLDEVSETSRQYVARAALSEQIETAEVLRRLSGEQSGLRGSGDSAQGFKLLYPVRRVIQEKRPVFQWDHLTGVSSYRVYILDADGNEVAVSEELAPNQTQWKGPALTRGKVFSWLVTAMVDGKNVVSPDASLPEIKFAVLSTADSQELARLMRSNSHFALGVFYARVGLVSEAEREIQGLVDLNPKAELPRKLLQSLRSSRGN